MKNLRRVELFNFQSHQYTNLNFEDGVNVIIGPSDSGKTSIIRGIKWVLFNEPSGTDFIRFESNEAKVILYFQDNTIIIRCRSKSKNYYEIIYPQGNAERFEGFGTKVPEEVIQITGIKKVNLDGNNLITLNISDQLESPFLITESPSIKANAIGKIAGVEKIDLALGKLSKDINEINSEKKSLEKERIFQLKKLEQFNYLFDEEIKLNHIEGLLNKVDLKRKKLEQYRMLYKEFDLICNSLNNIYSELKKYSKIEILDHNMVKLNQKSDKYYSILNYYTKNKKIETDILNQNIVLNRTKNIEELKPIVDKLAIKAPKVELMNNINNRFININNYINNEIKVLNKTENLENMNLVLINIDNSISKYNSIYNYNINLNILFRKISILGSVLEKDKSEYLSSIYEKLNSIYLIYTKSLALDEDYKKINNRINKGIIYINKFKNIDKCNDIIDEINMKFKLLDLISSYFKQIGILDSQIGNLKGKIKSENIYSNELMSKYINLLRKSAICPYCFNYLDEEHLNKIISEYGV